MIIERSGSNDNVVSAKSWEAIAELNRKASLAFIDFVLEHGSVEGSDYHVEVVDRNELEDDLKPHTKTDEQIMLQEKTSVFSVVTSAIGAKTGAGVSRETFHNGGTDYYEREPGITSSFGGFILLSEIFKPGTHPEIAELALASNHDLVDPDKLDARIITPEEYKQMKALAVLSKLTVEHLVDLKDIYWEVAHPGKAKPQGSESEVGMLKNLNAGEPVGLRTNTRYLNCAKHQFDPDELKNTLANYLYLNYDIDIGSISLHFKEDIAMAIEYGERAQSYFDKREISASKD